MECQTRSATQSYGNFRRFVAKGEQSITSGINRASLRFPFAFLALSTLGLIVYSLPGAVALSLCILQFARCRYSGEQLPGATLLGDGPINHCDSIRHDPASLLWSLSYGLIAAHFFIQLLDIEGTLGSYIPSLLLVSAITLPLGAAKSAMYTISRRGMLITSHSGFLAEAGIWEAWLVSGLFFGLLPALTVGLVSLFVGQVTITSYYLFGGLTGLGALYYLSRRTDIFVLGLPTAWDEVRTFSPVLGLLICLTGALALLLEKNFLGLTPNHLFEILLAIGLAITYIGARSIETDRKGMVRLVYTHRS